jgi:hypothetical protein
MRRRLWRGLLVAALAGARASTDAAAAEPDYSGPSVCAPPCPEGELCVGNRCVRPAEQSPATSPLPRDRPPPQQPAPPPGSAPTTGPQPGGVGDARRASSAVGALPPPASATPAPNPPARLQHDGSPRRQADKPTSALVKRRFLALPFVGVHSYRNEEAWGYGPGLRFGTVLGGRFSDMVSLNAEVLIDFSNPRVAPAPPQERAFHVAFKPMVDIPAGAVEVVFGFKLGVFLLRSEQAAGDLVVAGDTTGISAGLDGGLFIPVSVQTSVGLLISYDLMGGSSTCVVGSGGAGGASCGPATSQALGLSAGVLF